jgi:hypothetical protein
VTPDELVSLNLLRARELRGWTQQEAAAQISKHLGKDWSIPVYAAAERAHRTTRTKTFSATELVSTPNGFTLDPHQLKTALQVEVGTSAELLDHLQSARSAIERATRALSNKEQQ